MGWRVQKGQGWRVGFTLNACFILMRCRSSGFHQWAPIVKGIPAGPHRIAISFPAFSKGVCVLASQCTMICDHWDPPWQWHFGDTTTVFTLHLRNPEPRWQIGPSHSPQTAFDRPESCTRFGVLVERLLLLILDERAPLVCCK